MPRTTLPVAIALAALLGLLVAAPTSAATTGTVCGQVTAFTAPTATTDGSITIDGTTEVIEAGAVVDAATLTVLNAVAAADATTCLEIEADVDGNIVALDIAAQARICGTAALDTTTGVYSVDGVALPTTILAADAELTAFLDVAAAADAEVCADVTISGTTGLITTVRLDATLNLCGDVTLDADSAAVGGLDVPLAMLDAEARAVLQLAADADAQVCVNAIVDDTTLTQANLSADIDLCGEVTLDADGNAVVDGVVIDDALLDADAAALLQLAASADGTACVAVDAVTSNGDTVAAINVTIKVCAEVSAITDNTITLGDVTFVFAGAADADVEVGDEVCVTATTAPTGDLVITEFDAGEAGAGGAGPDAGGPGAGTGDGGGALPDTAVDSRADGSVLGMLLIIGAAVAGAVARRREAVVR